MGLVGIGQKEPAIADACRDGDLRLLNVLVMLLALRRLGDPGVRKFLADGDPSIVLEAARAINDEPMDDLTPALAELIDQPQFHQMDELMRRVLHANFQLGGKDKARAIAELWREANAFPCHCESMPPVHCSTGIRQ